jgi:hypothetical protein
MKKLIIFIALLASAAMADLFIAIPEDATKEEFDALNKLIRTNIDPQYDIKTMGVVRKDEKSGKAYLCGNWDVDGRKFQWKLEQAQQAITAESAKTASITNVVLSDKAEKTPIKSFDTVSEIIKDAEPVEENPK